MLNAQQVTYGAAMCEYDKQKTNDELHLTYPSPGNNDEGDQSVHSGIRRDCRLVSFGATLSSGPHGPPTLLSAKRIRFVRCRSPCRHDVLVLHAFEARVLCHLQTVHLNANASC